jgi:hypothetical protein
MGRKSPFEFLPTDAPLIGTMPDHFIGVMSASSLGKSYETIASELNLPIGTVKSRLNRGRAKLVAMRAEDAS